MKRVARLLLTAFSMLSFVMAFAQPAWDVDENSSFKDRVILGGNFGMSFGDITYIDISPRLGYRVTNKLTSGVGVSYRYYKYKYPGNTPDFETNSWAYSVFSRYQVYGPVFLHAEYEHLSYEYQDLADFRVRRTAANSFFAGGGIAQPIGNRAVFVIEVLYNFSHSNTYPYPYSNPVIYRVGFGASL